MKITTKNRPLLPTSFAHDATYFVMFGGKKCQQIDFYERCEYFDGIIY